MVNTQSVRLEGCPSGGPYSGCHVRGLNHMVNTQSVWLGGFPLQDKLFRNFFLNLCGILYRNFTKAFPKKIQSLMELYWNFHQIFVILICIIDMLFKLVNLA